MQEDLNLEAYHYDLPRECIAQHPADKRDNSRLMVLRSNDSVQEHRHFCDIHEYFRNNDILIVNNTKVFPARLIGRKETGGRIEVFLLELPKTDGKTGEAEGTLCLLKSSKRAKVGSRIVINKDLQCRVVDYREDGKAIVKLQFNRDLGIMQCLEEAGKVPLPPYIERNQGSTEDDKTRYQTVYADKPGAVAAPTAGLHFTEDLLQTLRNKGVDIGEVTLHVGYGTFAPVRETDITRHQIHSEYLTISQEVADKIADAKRKGGRVWAVGTTSVRSLEYAAKKYGAVQTVEDWCDLYIYPGFEFKVVDNLITNFHLPDSSLMFLVSALCGRKTLLDSYKEAIKKGYRFFSYGDAMAIIGKE